MAIFGKKLFYVLSTVLICDYVSSKAVKNEPNIKLYGWKVLIGDKYFNIFGECDGLFISSQVFITEAECFIEMMKSGNADKIYLANKGAKDVYYKIEKNNVYYNENLGKTYDSNFRRIATLISRKPITEDYISLDKNINEINGSKCYTSNENLLLNLNPCLTMEFNSITNYNIHDPAFLCSWLDYDFINSNVVICDAKDSSRKFFLGVLSSHRSSDDDGEWIGVENVADLQKNIDKKLKNL